MDALDITSRAGSPGALAAFGKNRDQSTIDKAEAVRLGKSVDSGEQLESKVREVAEEFVSVFMNQVMKSMRATVNETPEFHGDNGEKFFQEMLDTEQSKTLAKGSGYGLTDLIYESMMTSYRVQQPQEVSERQNDSMNLMDENPEMADGLAVSGIA